MISRRFMRSPTAATTGQGFTLIEMMVVVAIVAILAAIAVPNYTSYVQRSRIITGTSGLGDFRVRMEQYYLDNRTYRNGNACGIPDPPVVGSAPFAINCVAATANTYVVTATGQAAVNMQNFQYSIDQSGVKRTIKAGNWPGAAGTVGCWVVRPDHTCI